MTTPAEVLSMLKEKEVKFVDLRFTDTRGKEQHVTVPAHTIDAGLFRRRQDVRRLVDRRLEGHQRVRHGADAGCHHGGARSVLRRDHADHPLRRARAVDDAGLRARSALARRSAPRRISSRPASATRALFGPENEFFIFDNVRYGTTMQGSFFEIDSIEAAWSSGKNYEDGNKAHRPGVKGGYFPVPPVDSFQDLRSAMCLALEELGMKVEVHHHEVATAGQCEIGVNANTLVRKADEVQMLKYAIHNVAHAYGKTVTFMPKPIVGDNGNGMHVHQSISEGRQAAVRRRQVRGPVGPGAVLHRRHHQAREGDQRVHEREHQQLQAPGAGLRSAGDARVLRAQSLRVDPHSVGREPEGPPHRSALPGFDRESVPRLRRDADGGPRRHSEQDPSGRARGQGSVRPAAGRSEEHSGSLLLAGAGAARRSTRIAAS